MSERDSIADDAALHAECKHPDYEYATTTGPRKAWPQWDEPPEGEGWERNEDTARFGWDRFDYTEESYWRRRKVVVEVCGAELRGLRNPETGWTGSVWCQLPKHEPGTTHVSVTDECGSKEWRTGHLIGDRFIPDVTPSERPEILRAILSPPNPFLPPTPDGKQ